MKTKPILLVLLLLTMAIWSQDRYTISGYIYQKGSKESLIGVNVYAPEFQSGTSSNNYGFYSLSLPKGEYTIYYTYIGYKPIVETIILDKDIKRDVFIEEDNDELEEVVIVGKKRKKISQLAQMSAIELPVAQIKDIPALLGEKDVLKVLQLMPGVQSGSEGSSGIYVRGGGPDQNLVILDDAPVYNASHLFGFFSIFNGDALKSVSLTKGGFPAQYGGRLSSVLEMTMKDGNKEDFAGEVGVGLISSRATFEGPILKGKSSFLISGRRTYIDLLMKPLMPKDEQVGYYFYDLNAKVNYDFDDKNKLYLSGYFGRDAFTTVNEYDDYKSDFGLSWGNATGTLRWNHLFNNKTFANTSLIFSDYTFSIQGDEKDGNNRYELEYLSNIKDVGLKYDMQYEYSPAYSLKTGISSTLHKFSPSAVVVKNNSINQIDQEVKVVNTYESGVYLENKLKLWQKLHLNAGLRLSHYYHKNKSYFKPEPRFSGSYSFTKDISAKLSYAKMNQYVHLLSSTGVSLPLDLWVPTTNKVKPQESQQIAFGVVKDFNKLNFSLSLEGYYKKMNDIIGYKPGASFLLVDNVQELSEYSWEESIMRGQGWSYGMELFLQRKIGRLSGWLGYTLSWTEHQFDEANGGKKYYAKYDRRHDISLVTTYKITDNITLSGTWVYGTGNAINIVNNSYDAELPKDFIDRNQEVNSYGDKNSWRMKPYHRLDLGIQFHKQKKHYHRIWELSFYNAYMNKNPFMYNVSKHLEYKGGELIQRKNKLKQVSIFPIIPSISYTIKF